MNLKKYDWKKKSKTLLRNINPGDIFFFENKPNEYFFGRIISKNSLGHVAEIFDTPASEPDADLMASTKRISPPVILDSYSLFDRRAEGNWRIIAHQQDYTPPKSEPTRYTYGAGPTRKKVDIFDNEETITAEEAQSLPPYSPRGDLDIKIQLGIA